MAKNKRHLRIDGDALIEAMSPMLEGMTAYLDLESGEVIEIPSELMDVDLEEVEEARERIDSAPDRFEEIPRFEGREEYALMVEFAGNVDEARVADRLAAALDGKGAFRRFKDVLSAFPHLSERWLAFRDERLVEEARRWLHRLDIEPELVLRPGSVSSQPAPTPAKPPPIHLHHLLLLGAPEGKTELIDGSVRRVFLATSSSEARQVFKSLAREIYEAAGIAWRNRFIEGHSAIELGDHALEVEDRLVILSVKTPIELWRRFWS